MFFISVLSDTRFCLCSGSGCLVYFLETIAGFGVLFFERKTQVSYMLSFYVAVK